MEVIYAVVFILVYDATLSVSICSIYYDNISIKKHSQYML